VIEFRIAWRGLDLYDSIEEEGMTLTARACYRIACELASSIGKHIAGYIPGPWQDDAWASLDFPNLGQKVRCIVSLQADNDYSIDISCLQGLLRTLTGRQSPPVDPRNVEIVRKALESNERFHILNNATDNKRMHQTPDGAGDP